MSAEKPELQLDVSATTDPATTVSVVMRRVGQHCIVDPACESVLRSILSTCERRCRHDADGSLMVQRRRKVLYEPDQFFGKPVLKFWAGLVRPVWMGLER